MAAEGGGQAVCAFESAAAELGDGVWLLQECTLADHSRIRYEASVGERSDEARGHGATLRDLFLERFDDSDGAIAHAITGAGSSIYVRITATEVQPGDVPASFMVGGLVARLQGNKAIIPLAAVRAAYAHRGHMRYLYRKVTADFLSRHGVRDNAVEADAGYWSLEEFGLDLLIDKRGRDFADKLGYTQKDVREFEQMRSMTKVPLLVGALTTAADVPLPLTKGEADARAAPAQRSGGALRGTRAGSKDWSFSPGKVELYPGQELVGFFKPDINKGTDRPTLGLGNTAGEAEGKAGRDLLFLVAAHACGAPVPERLCPNSSLDLAVENGLDGIKDVKDWLELKPKLKAWRTSGKLQAYLRQVAASVPQAGGQRGEGTAQRPRGRGARAAKRPATRSEQAQRKKKPRVAEAAEQAQQDGEAPAPQPAAPEAQQGGVAAPAGQPAAAEVPLLDLLLDAVDQDQAAAAPAGLTAELVGAYWAQHLDLLEAQQAGKEAALRTMLRRLSFAAVVAFLKKGG